jgi:glycosyltransferase involved in cell wall biosynthesis
MLETTAPSSGPAIPVVRIITRLNIGGPSIQAASLSSALIARGFTTTLVHGRLGPGEGDMSYLVAPGVTTVFVPSLAREIQPVADLRALFALLAELRRRRPRIVHTHMAKAGLLGRLAAAIYNLTRGDAPRAKVVHTYHGHVLEGYFGPVKTAVFISLERLMARATDAIVAIAPAIHRELLDEYRIGSAGQYRIIPLGFDLAPFAAVDAAARSRARTELGIPDDAPVVTTVGRLTAIKQHAKLLEVARLVTARHANAVFLIVGDGELRGDLEAQAARLGLGGHVKFLGWRRDLATIYAATDVFALTSRNEGTPVALIEAMASGVPGVSTNVGGVPTVIANRDMGVLVGPDDDRGFAEAVAGLLDRPGDAAAMGARGRDHVMAHFDSRRLNDDIERLYRELLAR